MALGPDLVIFELISSLYIYKSEIEGGKAPFKKITTII